LATDFHSLPFDQQKLHLTDVARRALGRWGYPETSKLTLLNITENATFRVEAPGFNKIVMRVHRIAYAEKDSIRTELDWLQYLNAHSPLKVVHPLKAVDGTLVQTVETPAFAEQRNVVCFAFAAGKAPRDSQDDNEEVGKLVASVSWIPQFVTVPLFKFAAVLYDLAGRGSNKKSKLTREDVALYGQLGTIVATLHNQTWAPPPFYQRIEWDYEATFGTGWNNYYGKHYRDCRGVLGRRDLKVLDECAALIHRRVEAFGKGAARYGMIHSDLRLANLLADGPEITVLDFDDCGRGWFLYDVACILGFQEHRPDLHELLDIIVEGYRKVRPVSDAERREIATFVMIRRIGLLQAILYHLNNTSAGAGESAELSPEVLGFYAKGTAVLARRYLKTFSSLPLPFPNQDTEATPAPGREAVGV
jgi:Ser/Thr protein kinase RdoA (MazF antagonist)